MNMTKHNPLTFEQLRALRKPIKNPNREHREKLKRLDKLALFITERIGTMGFFLIVVSWTVLWLGWNVFAPKHLRFDPFPAFALWLFISNMMQLMFLPLLMVGQNLQGKHSEKRAEADYEVNLKAEREIETILQHLENQNELILKILNRFENK